MLSAAAPAAAAALSVPLKAVPGNAMHSPLQPPLEPVEREESARPGVGEAIWRGLRGRCPACGQAKLFARFLRQVASCPACHEPLGHLRSDDAAPWLTILVVGHIAVPVMLAVERHSPWPIWLAMTVWPLFALGLTLAVLPRAKGVLLSIIWATRAPGSEHD
jgi:uncharacterized protein (DUF983 family)